MDACGNYPPPSREEAAAEVLVEVQKTVPGNHIEVCRRVVLEMKSLGSCMGWQIFSKPDAVAKVLHQLNPPLSSSRH
jgi:hypothetical protein